MFSTVYSGALHGIHSYLVRVEVDIAPGLPNLQLVGYVSSEVAEAKERVRAAVRNMGVELPAARITINLAPANVRKEGTVYDLSIAVGILQSMKQLPQEQTRKTLFLGEMGLNGSLKPVLGVLPILREAVKQGFTRCVLPRENAREAAVVEGIPVPAVTIRIFGAAAVRHRPEEDMPAGFPDQFWIEWIYVPRWQEPGFLKRQRKGNRDAGTAKVCGNGC